MLFGSCWAVSLQACQSPVYTAGLSWTEWFGYKVQTLQRRNGLCFPNKVELGSEARTLDGLAWALPQAVGCPPLFWDFWLPVKPDVEPVLGTLDPAWGGSGGMCGEEDWTPLKWLTPCASRLGCLVATRSVYMSLHKDGSSRGFILLLQV